jgi:uncharacterized damage-inducible protein DinB
MNLSDIRHLFDYTEWANELTLNAASELSDEDLRRDFKISHSSILGTLLHMAGVEWIWLERWQGRSPVGKKAWSLWTVDSGTDLSTLRQRWSDVVDRRAEFIGALDESRFTAKLPFTLLNGDSDSLILAGQMQHVVNHATLHRGQVVGMIRQLGIAPPATDLLFYLRREIPA